MVFLLLDYVQDEYTLRLRGSNVPGQGRLEVFYHGQWGTVCNNEWGQNEARVRSLLFTLKQHLSHIFKRNLSINNGVAII